MQLGKQIKMNNNLYKTNNNMTHIYKKQLIIYVSGKPGSCILIINSNVSDLSPKERKKEKRKNKAAKKTLIVK